MRPSSEGSSPAILFIDMSIHERLFRCFTLVQFEMLPRTLFCRSVSEMIRPTAMEFLDRLLKDDRKLRIEDVRIPDVSNLVGHTLAEAEIRATGALVIAVRKPDGTFIYNPQGGERLEAGSSLIVIAHTEDVRRLRERLARDTLLRGA